MTLQTVITIIVVLSALATVTLWREAARKAPRPKKKFIKALLHSEPITPKYQPPSAIGKDFPSLVTDEDSQFFGDFADFAAVVNWWLADDDVGSPWRLQELPDTELKLGVSDMPEFGRRYAVFHNQVRLGTLEVSPWFPYSAQEPNVFTTIKLDSVRLLGFDTVREFLSIIARHVSDANQNSAEHLRTQQDIDGAMTQVVWQALQASEFGMDGEDWGELELSLPGTASWYLARREALRKRQTAA